MLNILYVEDDPGSRRVVLMTERMSPGLFELTVFENSYDFDEHLRQLDPQPDMFLLDIHVEPYNGFEMLTMIRQQAAFDDVPVVALTASVMNEEIHMLKTAGFNSVLSKPLDVDEFPNLIQRIIEGERIWYIW